MALAAGAGAAAQPAGPCGTKSRPPTTYAHVIWIWLENHSYGQAIGGSYTSSLASGCGLATNYRAVAHPSLPNYIAATSGSTAGISDDAPPSVHPLAGPSIFEQARSAGSFQESMPANCSLTDAHPYAVKHNPEAYYTRIRAACAKDNVALDAFGRALKTGTVPAFSFVTPNLCNDTHDCPVATGDEWLRKWVPAVTSSAAYRAGKTVLIVTWDEADSSTPANHVATIVVSPYTGRGTTSGRAFSHYSLLRTTEELLGIPVHLGRAASAPSMRSAFGLVAHA